MTASTSILACSGGSDVDEIAARSLADAGKMYCLAGVGAVESLI